MEPNNRTVLIVIVLLCFYLGWQVRGLLADIDKIEADEKFYWLARANSKLVMMLKAENT